MMSRVPDLSVIIVSYNVRAFLLQCLQSVKRAVENIPSEIYVVDNASVDGSAEAVRLYFPEVRIIQNKKNVGFSAANNMALKRVSGRYVLLLNPDTVVQEDTFSTLIGYMDRNPDVGASTCKILNPDGSFSVDARHSIPSPSTALWKLLGLNRLFPKSRIFGRYNMTYLDPDETNDVDAISGSFMFLRREMISEVGCLDEIFFMYCEDIDYCYRITQSGHRIVYVPETQIIHYKGESTKKTDLDYVVNFNRSLYIFYKKHFHQHYLKIFSLAILSGVLFRGAFVYIKNLLRKHAAALLDFFLLNMAIFCGFYVRFEWGSHFRWADFINQYIWIHVTASVLFLICAFFFELYEKYRYSLIQVIKTIFFTFLILSALTFFIKQLAFSRVVVLLAAILGTALLITWRAVLRSHASPGGKTFSRSIFSKRALLVGTDQQSREVLQKFQRFVMSNVEIKGIVSTAAKISKVEIEGIPVVTTLDNLQEFIRLERINQLIFTSHQIPYKTILGIMARTRKSGIEFKMIPEQLDVIIGKSQVEHLEQYPLLDLEYRMANRFNLAVKRGVDIILSAVILLPTMPLWVSGLLFVKKSGIPIQDDEGEPRLLLQLSSAGWLAKKISQLFLLLYVFKGTISFVGAPLTGERTQKAKYLYKAGLTGLVQLNSQKIRTAKNREIYELYYIRNQDIWLDLEILLKTLFTKKTV